MGILSEAPFALHSTYHTTKVKSPGQLVFGRDMKLLINHVADWRYMRQRKQSQIYKDVIRETTTAINHNYRAVGKLLTKTKL